MTVDKYGQFWPRHETYEAGTTWFEAMYCEYWPTVESVVDRPAVSWGRCVELAEIAWAGAPKEWVVDGGHPHCTGRLEANRKRTHSSDWDRVGHVLAPLIEGLLSLGGGERFDPKMMGGVNNA